MCVYICILYIMNINVCIYRCVSIDMYKSIYDAYHMYHMYIYTHTYNTYIHIHTYTYIEKETE